MNDLTPNETKEVNTGTAKVIYILLIVSTLVGLTGIIGLIMAYVMQSDADDWLKTHYRWQIRTFWIGFLYTMIGAVTLTTVVGYIVLLFTFIWLIVRCAKGLSALEKNKPVTNVENWLFG
jgi:uncharacterized membrane protein